MSSNNNSNKNKFLFNSNTNSNDNKRQFKFAQKQIIKVVKQTNQQQQEHEEKLKAELQQEKQREKEVKLQNKKQQLMIKEKQLQDELIIKLPNEISDIIQNLRIDICKQYLAIKTLLDFLQSYNENQNSMYEEIKDESNSQDSIIELPNYIMNAQQYASNQQDLAILSSKWAEIRVQVDKLLCMIDSEQYCQNLQLSYQIQSNQIKLKNLNYNPYNLKDQFQIFNHILQIIKESLTESQAKIDLREYYIQFKIQGSDGNEVVKSFWSYTIDASAFYEIIIDFINNKIQRGGNQFSLVHHRLLKLYGLDSNYSNQSFQNNLRNISVQKMTVSKINPLPIRRQLDENEFEQIQHEEYHDADLTLYAISRARVQYLGLNIPIFRLKHCLFEALMLAIHQDEFQTESDSCFDLTVDERMKQQAFLLSKVIEFNQSSHLQNLISLSQFGKTIEFIKYFNDLSSNISPNYSRYKITLYDINQRKFIVKDDQQQPHIDIYLVHYNGYVFATNYPKLIVIRERETQMSQKHKVINGFDSDNEDLIEVNKQDKINLLDFNDSPEKSNTGIHSIYELPSELKDLSQSYKSQKRDEDEISDVEVKSAYIMSSNMLKNNTRRTKLSQLVVKDGRGTSQCGILTYKVEFQNNSEFSCPKRLLCYGRVYQEGKVMIKEFQGKNCYIKFLLWILQHMIDYHQDSRKQSQFLNVFSFKGQGKEMNLILRGLTQIVGRDVHFIGDLNKLKLVWTENIRFYDFDNYFEGNSMKYYKDRWNISTKNLEQLEINTDKIAQYCILTYEIMQEFFRALKGVKFANQIYDFTLQAQGSGSSLALSIFQYYYLDKQHIKGTHDLEVLDKERSSFKSANYFINQLNEDQFTPHKIDHSSNIYRLYEINDSLAFCFQDYPIPIEFSKRKPTKIEIQFQQGQFKLDYKKQQYLYVFQENIRFKLMYTSLYKVDKIVKKERNFLIPQQENERLNYAEKEIENQYIWGVELIESIVCGNINSISYLKISEEMIYLQSRIFNQFVTDLLSNYENNKGNPVVKDLIQMILSNFHYRFSQKYVGLYQIMHINDLSLMRQTIITNDSQIQKIIEIAHPFYMIEYFPDGSDQLQQIGSLSRIASYVNACNRAHLNQILMKISSDNIIFMDSQYLLLKNQWLFQNDLNPGQNFTIGRYKEIFQSKIEQQDRDQQIDEDQRKFQSLLKYFSQRKILIPADQSRNISVNECVNMIIGNINNAEQDNDNLDNLKGSFLSLSQVDQKDIIQLKQSIIQQIINLIPASAKSFEKIKAMQDQQLNLDQDQEVSHLNFSFLKENRNRVLFEGLLSDCLKYFEENFKKIEPIHEIDIKLKDEILENQYLNENQKKKEMKRKDSSLSLLSQNQCIEILQSQSDEDSKNNIVGQKRSAAGSLVQAFFSQI